VKDGINMTTRRVHVQGSIEPLTVNVGMCSCGDIERGEGIAFRFGDEGIWAVPLDELRAIVREADEYRAKYGDEIRAAWAQEEADDAAEALK
jgi:hypothetical protein